MGLGPTNSDEKLATITHLSSAVCKYLSTERSGPSRLTVHENGGVRVSLFHGSKESVSLRELNLRSNANASPALRDQQGNPCRGQRPDLGDA